MTTAVCPAVSISQLEKEYHLGVETVHALRGVSVEVPQGDFVAQSLGMPDVPRVQLPHPVAGTGVESMRLIADKVVAEIIAALEGS